MLESGAIVAGYRIDGVVGAGGMGVVYQATQLSLDRTVALKMISAELGSDAAFRERFRREGRIQAALEHPHIVTVHEAGESEHGLFIAMRLIEGQNLKDLIVERELDPFRATRLLSQIAGALDTAHRAGLIHRDIKPSNVLVHAEGDHAYLADFGATKLRSGVSLTATGQLVGTPDYMAPEQILGQPATQRTDIYALGAVLFECLTGQRPYERDADLAVLYAHLNEPPPAVTSYRGELPAAVDEAVRRAMAKAPEDRYATATELLADVERGLEGRPLSTRATEPPPTLAVTTPPAPSPPEPATELAVERAADETLPQAAAPSIAVAADRPATPAARIAPLASAGALALLATIAFSFASDPSNWNSFAVFSPVEAVVVALLVLGAAQGTSRLDPALSTGLLVGFGVLSTVGGVMLISFAIRRLGTGERLAAVVVLLGGLAVLAAGVWAWRLVATESAAGLNQVALVLAVAGGALLVVSLFVDYDGFSSLLLELQEGTSAEFFFEPVFAIALAVVALVVLAGSARARFGSGLLLAAGTQSALHYIGLILAAALAVGERGDVRSGGFIGLAGGLLVVAAAIAIYAGSRREAALSSR